MQTGVAERVVPRDWDTAPAGAEWETLDYFAFHMTPGCHRRHCACYKNAMCNRSFLAVLVAGTLGLQHVHNPVALRSKRCLLLT